MARKTAIGLVGALLLLALPVLSPPARAQRSALFCPAMTDSIDRLYHAYFQREPDPTGFDHWTESYRTGRHGLPQISQYFAESAEFAQKGLVSDRTFVLWVYRNLIGREPEANELDYWMRALASGYPRGAMMLTLTESYDYVVATGTVTPLAGYRRWYPDGTHWYCDIGPQTVEVVPLTGEVWADYYLSNGGAVDQPGDLWTLHGDGSRNVQMRSGTLGPGATDYNWDGVFSGDGDYGRYLLAEVGPSVTWIVVFYPYSIGPERIGWEL
ncbi:MAG: DUF4214 domain-containing protein [Acidimicrobiales bacterium]